MAVDKVYVRRAVMQDGKLDICEKEYKPENAGELFARKQIEQFRRCMAFDAVKAMDVQYPCTDKNKGTDGYTIGEGFLWFVDNKTKRIVNSRNEMRYEEYMKPMEPKLERTEKSQMDSNGGKYGNKNQNNRQKGNRLNNNHMGNQNEKSRK